MTEVICTDTGAGWGRGKSESKEKKGVSGAGRPTEEQSRAEPCYAGTQRAFPWFWCVLCHFLNVLFWGNYKLDHPKGCPGMLSISSGPITEPLREEKSLLGKPATFFGLQPLN